MLYEIIKPVLSINPSCDNIVSKALEKIDLEHIGHIEGIWESNLYTYSSWKHTIFLTYWLLCGTHQRMLLLQQLFLKSMECKCFATLRFFNMT